MTAHLRSLYHRLKEEGPVGIVGAGLSLLLLALFLAQIGLLILTLTGAGLLLALDTLSVGLTRLGLNDPVMGWAILGVAFGGVYGLTQALRRMGRSDDIPKVGVGVFVMICGILILGYFTRPETLSRPVSFHTTDVRRSTSPLHVK
jgi:hypothetical protein